jgi:hypothetical protein
MGDGIACQPLQLQRQGTRPILHDSCTLLPLHSICLPDSLRRGIDFAVYGMAK